MFVASSSLNIHLHQDRQTDKQTWRFINFIIIIIIIIFFFFGFFITPGSKDPRG